MATPTATALPKLAITCTGSDCANDLHCFRSTKKLRESGLDGACRSCHVQLIDWSRVQEREFTDVDHTFDELRHELIRHHFWHVEFDERARNHALRKGRTVLVGDVSRRIATSVGPAMPMRDGQQTSFTGNVIFYGQHATAACCRRCIDYWHGIPMGRPLTGDEQEYLTALVIRYIDDRWPDLPDGPTKVPPRKRPKAADDQH